MLSFSNTKHAFETKSDKDLRKEYWMYKLVRKRWLVKMGKATVPFFLNIGLPIKGLIRDTVFAQFCGGESIDDCDEKIQTLYDHNVGTILDYSIEGQTEEEEFDATCEEIKRTIDKASGNKAIPFAVFKVTGLARHALLEKCNPEAAELTDAEQEEFNRVKQRVGSICGYAAKKEVPLFIDAEETWIQNTIDRLALAQMKKYNRESVLIFNTFQMYRTDRLGYLKECIAEAKKEDFQIGAKLVRGAYMIKERKRAQAKGYTSPIQPDKNSTDINYNNAIKLLITELETCAFACGTHNEDSNHFLAHLIEKHHIDKHNKRIFFAQLLGMSDHITFNLSNYGYEVAKYVPYGPIKEVMPYLLRRADENASVTGQTGRELRLINKERERRKMHRKFEHKLQQAEALKEKIQESNSFSNDS